MCVKRPVAVWLSGNTAFFLIKVVALRRARLVGLLGWVTVRGYTILVSIKPPGTQVYSLLSLAIPPWIGAMSMIAWATAREEIMASST